MAGNTLSDKAMAVFAFAAYHQLSAGEHVTDVVLHDGAGHSADSAAISELEGQGLVETRDDRAVFTEDGRTRLDRVIAALRSAA